MKQLMMDNKSLFVLHPHSFVDVITNSSTELFVTDSNKTKETVKEILELLIQTYNTATNSKYEYDNCIGEVYTITEENYEDFFNEYIINWGYVPNWRDVRFNYFKEYTLYREGYRKRYGSIPEYDYDNSAEYKKFCNLERKAVERKIKKYKEKYFEEYKKECLGRVCIFSNGDNAIPYEIFELIESGFNAKRMHLG